jgi:type II secretory pathway pseudopilin PulG
MIQKDTGAQLRKGHAFTLLELLVVMAVVIILAALLLPSLHRSSNQAQNSACVGQLRQLGLAVRLYAEDNKNTFPSAELLPTLPVSLANPMPRICDVLMPYVTGANGNNTSFVFRCPADNRARFVTEGSSYEWNTELNSRRLDETGSQTVNYSIEIHNTYGILHTNGTTVVVFPPGTTPLMLDYDNFHPRSKKSGKNAVFMDEHVSTLDSMMPD